MPENSLFKIERSSIRLAFIVLIGSFILSSGLAVFLSLRPSALEIESTDLALQKFKSTQEISEYFNNQKQAATGLGQLETLDTSQRSLTPEVGVPLESLTEPVRYSETNVQVAGIDEPDIVKTDGKNIFFSNQDRFYIQRDIIDSAIVPPVPARDLETKIVSAFPPETMEEINQISENGELLLKDGILVVFSNKLRAYDVYDPTDINSSWFMDLDENQQVTDARLYKNHIYLITKKNVGRDRPVCPMSLAEGMSIRCTDIWYPPVNINADSIFTVAKIDFDSGEVVDSASFVGSSSQSVIYMSENSVYVTYSHSKSYYESFVAFVNITGTDIFPENVIDEIRNLSALDISTQAKEVELQVILESFFSNISNEEQRNLQNKLSQQFNEYLDKNARNIQRTAISKFDIDSLNPKTGEVPGYPLNQFSLDEYKGNLRIATTIGGSSFSSGESLNDVYVLNESLDEIGSIKNLGIDERIYSARFIGDKGYLVTFKQIDPFYVMDMSNPKNPQVKGELKIPGFSSYLHPISQNKILGVGREGSDVKLSLFDVSDPTNPTEISKYILEEFWSEVQNNHHAFLLDTKHEIFFLPAGNSGFIFSYTDDNLSLVREVEAIQAKRAVFIEDYLYVIGEREIEVYDEVNWELINTITLSD